jgi:hypothetical protein
MRRCCRVYFVRRPQEESSTSCVVDVGRMRPTAAKQNSRILVIQPTFEVPTFARVAPLGVGRKHVRSIL